jgi:hypothetical protein
LGTYIKGYVCANRGYRSKSVNRRAGSLCASPPQCCLEHLFELSVGTKEILILVMLIGRFADCAKEPRADFLWRHDKELGLGFSNLVHALQPGCDARRGLHFKKLFGPRLDVHPYYVNPFCRPFDFLSWKAWKVGQSRNVTQPFSFKLVSGMSGVCPVVK